MTEKKTAIKLTAETKSGAVAADLKRCIICQKLTPEPTTSTENGGKRVREAALIREDVVSKRLKVLLTNHFAALMTNPEHYLEDFGTKMDEGTIDKAEEYLTQVLKKGTKFKKMDQLRSELYHHSKSVT